MRAANLFATRPSRNLSQSVMTCMHRSVAPARQPFPTAALSVIPASIGHASEADMCYSCAQQAANGPKAAAGAVVGKTAVAAHDAAAAAQNTAAKVAHAVPGAGGKSGPPAASGGSSTAAAMSANHVAPADQVCIGRAVGCRKSTMPRLSVMLQWCNFNQQIANNIFEQSCKCPLSICRLRPARRRPAA